MNTTTLKTWRAAQDSIKAILASLGSDSGLMLAAAANPLLALKELGYVVPPDVAQEFEDRIRFGEAGFEQRRNLRERMFEIAGQRFDLNSPDSVLTTLNRLLGDKAKSGAKTLTGDTVAPLRAPAFSSKVEDPLGWIRGLHPIAEPLLEYRGMDATVPGLAPQELYDQIRNGKKTVGISRLVPRLRSQKQ